MAPDSLDGLLNIVRQFGLDQSTYVARHSFHLNCRARHDNFLFIPILNEFRNIVFQLLFSPNLSNNDSAVVFIWAVRFDMHT